MMPLRPVVLVPGIHTSRKEACGEMGGLGEYLVREVPGLCILVYSPGWIPAFTIAGPLLGRIVRRHHAKAFQRWLKDKMQRHGFTEPPSVIAHSFGGYIVHRAMTLKAGQPCAIYDRVILMGAAVSTRAKLSEECKHFRSLVNFYSRQDGVIHISTIGQAGYAGFCQSPPAQNIEMAGYDHCDYLKEGTVWEIIADELRQEEA